MCYQPFLTPSLGIYHRGGHSVFSPFLNTHTWNISQRWAQCVLSLSKHPHLEYITAVGIVCSHPFQTPTLEIYHRGGHSVFSAFPNTPLGIYHKSGHSVLSAFPNTWNTGTVTAHRRRSVHHADLVPNGYFSDIGAFYINWFTDL